MSEFKETNETAGEVGEANEIKLPQEVPVLQQEVQEPQETSVAKGDIAAELKKETPTNKEVSVSQKEVQTSQETNLTTDDIAGALKKDDISQRRPLKTDYSTVLWGKAADEVNQENKDVNQFVQELEQKGLTPEQYLAQKLAESAALDDPIRKEGQEPQATSVPKDSIAAALKKEVPTQTEVHVPQQQETQMPRETTAAQDTANSTPSLSKELEDLLREVQLERQRDTLAKEAEADAHLLDEQTQNNGSKVSKEHKVPATIIEQVDRINSVRYATEVANAEYPNIGTDLPNNLLKGVVGEGTGYTYLQDRLIAQIHQEAKATKSVVESEKISDLIANRITRHPENLKTTDGDTIEPDYTIANSDGVVEEIVDSKAFSLLYPAKAVKAEEFQIRNIEGTIEKYSKADLPGLKQITILAPYEFATTPRIKEQIENMSRRGINVRLEFTTSEAGRNEMVNDIRHSPKPGQPPSSEQLNRLREIQKLPDDARRQAFSKFLDEIPSAPSESNRTGQSKKPGQ